jgi:hypothetical protein
MDWVQDMTARWVRILGAAGEARTPLDEAVHEISAIAAWPGSSSGSAPWTAGWRLTARPAALR